VSLGIGWIAVLKSHPHLAFVRDPSRGIDVVFGESACGNRHDYRRR
jgi:hypothetical protein